MRQYEELGHPVATRPPNQQTWAEVLSWFGGDSTEAVERCFNADGRVMTYGPSRNRPTEISDVPADVLAAIRRSETERAQTACERAATTLRYGV